MNINSNVKDYLFVQHVGNILTIKNNKQLNKQKGSVSYILINTSVLNKYPYITWNRIHVKPIFGILVDIVQVVIIKLEMSGNSVYCFLATSAFCRRGAVVKARFTLNREESYTIVSDRRELYSRLFTIVYDCAKLDRGLSWKCLSPRSTAMHYDQI